ncbi:hypothetical protein [Amycolatopsis anabasis]|uniref:hypothetical protein n=1 Tax=Amycolatopsis anabasis TaxID=1840409 RepID=UPI00131A8930|nr:hypothetical protein [Amycolatopsis anabasis]
MGDRVSAPYMVYGARQLAGKLLLGNWCVFRHEHLGPDGDLDEWKLALLEVGDAMGVKIDFLTIPKKDVTIAFNDAAVPTFEQVAASVSAIDHYRFTGS